jgi:hypothetical protein
MELLDHPILHLFKLPDIGIFKFERQTQLSENEAVRKGSGLVESMRIMLPIVLITVAGTSVII